MSPSARLFILAVAAATSAACGTTSRIVREQPAELVEFTPEARVAEVWTASVGSGTGKQHLRIEPALDGRRVYVADWVGRVYALDADSGEILWERNVEQPVTGATAAGAGMVVVGTKEGQVISLDSGSGEQRWVAAVSSEVLAPPAVAGDVVVAQTIDGKVYALAIADGKRRWVYTRSEPPLSLRGTSAPVVAGELVLAGFASGKLAALRLSDGRLQWEVPVAEPRGRNEIERLVDVDVSPLVLGNAVYAAAYQGKVVAIDRNSGRIAWSRDLSTHSGMDADRENLYVTDERGHVIALDLRTGASVWKQDKLRGRGLGAPVYVDGYVAVGDFEGYVHWLSRVDGKLVARHRVGSKAVGAQGVARDGTVFLLSRGGTLAALRLTTPP